MPHVSFRAALLAGAFAFASTAGFVLSGGPAGAQDSDTETTTPAPEAPATEVPATEAPATEAPAEAAPAEAAPAETAPSGTVPSGAAPVGTPTPTANGAPTPAPADPNEVVATVNGKPVTRQDVLNSASDLPPQVMAQLDQYFPQLLNRLIGIQLVEAEGREQGLAEDPEVKKFVQQAESEAISRTSFSAWSTRRSPMRRSRRLTTPTSPRIRRRSRSGPATSW